MDDAPRSARHPELIKRRDVISGGLKAAYVIPAILAAVKVTERPAYAFVSGGNPEPPRYEPLPPQPDPQQPPQEPQPPTNSGPGDPHGHPPPNNHPAPPNHPPSDNHPDPEGEPTITHHMPLPDGVHARSRKPVSK
jgi:hypothetical protein